MKFTVFPMFYPLIFCALLAQMQPGFVSAENHPAHPAGHANWPKEVIVTVGDIRTRVAGPKMWTLSGIDFQNTAMATQDSAYGTVLTIRGVGPVPFELKAGTMSMHADMIVHGSAPNTSDRRRCGLTIRYIPAEVRSTAGWNKFGVICRGRDDSGHWANLPRPAGEDFTPKPWQQEIKAG